MRHHTLDANSKHMGVLSPPQTRNARTVLVKYPPTAKEPVGVIVVAAQQAPECPWRPAFLTEAWHASDSPLVTRTEAIRLWAWPGSLGWQLCLCLIGPGSATESVPSSEPDLYCFAFFFQNLWLRL